MTLGSTIKVREVPAAGDNLPGDLHPVIRRILLSRGVHQSDGLDLGLRQLNPPGGLLGLGEAARILTSAVMDDHSILIVGDFDADGATGTALAVRALRAMGAEIGRAHV